MPLITPCGCSKMSHDFRQLPVQLLKQILRKVEWIVNPLPTIANSLKSRKVCTQFECQIINPSHKLMGNLWAHYSRVMCRGLDY